MPMPSLMDVHPVRIGEASATEAAEKAPTATGGVIYDSIPQYMKKRWVAIGLKPDSMRAGAMISARKI